MRTTFNQLVAASSIAILLSACAGGTGTTPSTSPQALAPQSARASSARRPHSISQTYPCVLPTVPLGDGVKCTRQPSVTVTGFGIGGITPGYVTGNGVFELTVLVTQNIPCYDTSLGLTFASASTLVTFYDANGNQLFQQNVDPSFQPTSCDAGNGVQYAGAVNLGSLYAYYKGTSTIDHIVFKDTVNFGTSNGPDPQGGVGTFYPELLEYIDGAPVHRGGGGTVE